MDFGMPFLIETKTQQECIALCKKLGLKFIEWNMNFPQCQLERFDVQQLRQTAEKENIYFTIHLDERFDVCDFNPRVQNVYMETAKAAIELAEKIGAPIVNMHLAKGIFVTLPDTKEYLYGIYEEEYQKSILRFRDMCEKAVGSSGVKIGVENTEGFREHEKRAVELLLESSCFGLTLDIGHSRIHNDIDLPFYEKHREKLIHMHAHDADNTHNHLAFGDGDMDLWQKLDMAKSAGCRVVLETKTVDALTRTAEYVKTEFSDLWENNL